MADSAAPALVPVFPFNCSRKWNGDALKLDLQKQWRQLTRFAIGVEYVAETVTSALSDTSSVAHCTETGLIESPVDTPPPSVKQEWTVWKNLSESSSPVKIMPEIRVERLGDVGWWCVKPTNNAEQKTVYVKCDLANVWLDEVLCEKQAAWSSFFATRAPFIVVESNHGDGYNFKKKIDDPDWTQRGMMFLKAQGAKPFALEDAGFVKDTRRLGLRPKMIATLNGKDVSLWHDKSCDMFYVLDTLDEISSWWSPIMSRAVWDGLDTSNVALDMALRRDAVRAALESIDWDDKSRSENEKALQRALELLDCPASELPP
jgi:hypothetical protein